MNLTKTREKVNELLSDCKAVNRQHKEEQSNLKQSTKQLSYIEEAQVITQQVSQAVQQQAHDKIAGVVDRCLKTVFDDSDYGFKINFEKKRGRTEAKLILLNRGHEVDDPLEADSGGVLDVAALALRLSCLILNKPALRRVLVLDEPFKNVSPNYRDNIRMLLEGLAKDFKIQFILVTHDKIHHCGTVFNL